MYGVHGVVLLRSAILQNGTVHPPHSTHPDLRPGLAVPDVHDLGLPPLLHSKLRLHKHKTQHKRNTSPRGHGQKLKEKDTRHGRRHKSSRMYATPNSEKRQDANLGGATKNALWACFSTRTPSATKQLHSLGHDDRNGGKSTNESRGYSCG